MSVFDFLDFLVLLWIDEVGLPDDDVGVSATSSEELTVSREVDNVGAALVAVDDCSFS